MVPKRIINRLNLCLCFRAVLFRMVPKLEGPRRVTTGRFRAVLFRMVPKLLVTFLIAAMGFRAVLFRMVPKQQHRYIS